MKPGTIHNWKILLSGGLLVALVALWTFWGTTQNLFVWDSTEYLFDHEEQISSLHFENLIWMLTSLEFYNWHPLTWLSWAVDYQLYGGLDPWGYHLSNNILHAINSALVFVLMLVVFGLNSAGGEGMPCRSDIRAVIAALLLSLAFAVHPQHVETVAWVADRKGLLAQMFLLLATLAYVRYVSGGRGEKRRWYLTTLGLFLAALMSKPMAVTFPGVLLLLDLYPLRRTSLLAAVHGSIHQRSLVRLLAEKLPFVTLSILSALLTMVAQQEAMRAIPLAYRILNVFNSINLYIVKLLIPLHFSPHYPYFLLPNESITARAFAPVVGFLGFSLIAVSAWFKGHRAFLPVWLIYLLTLLPVLGIVQVGTQGAADRYAYLTTLPVYFLAAAGILHVLDHSTRMKKTLLVLACVPILVWLSFSTQQQVKIWQSPLKLWSQAAQSFPDYAFVVENLGVAYFNAGDYENAVRQFEASERLQTHSTKLLAWRSLSYLLLGRYAEALDDHINMLAAADFFPDFELNEPCVKYNIGWIYTKLGRFSEAIQQFEQVDPASDSGPETAIWLQRLRTASPADHRDLIAQDLPGFCTVLIAGSIRVTGSND